MTDKGARLRVEIAQGQAVRPATLACRYSVREAGLWTDFGGVQFAPIREWPIWDGVELIANGHDGSIFGLQGYCPREVIAGDLSLNFPRPFDPEAVFDADVLVTSIDGAWDYEFLVTDDLFVACAPKVTATTFVRPGADGLTLGIAGDLLCALYVKRMDGRSSFRRSLRRIGFHL